MAGRQEARHGLVMGAHVVLAAADVREVGLLPAEFGEDVGNGRPHVLGDMGEQAGGDLLGVLAARAGDLDVDLVELDEMAAGGGGLLRLHAHVGRDVEQLREAVQRRCL